MGDWEGEKFSKLLFLLLRNPGEWNRLQEIQKWIL
jgi:hypothetical protein